jgi:hypothetical protein
MSERVTLSVECTNCGAKASAEGATQQMCEHQLGELGWKYTVTPFHSKNPIHETTLLCPKCAKEQA